MLADPALTILVRRTPGTRILADLRTSAGVKEAVDADAYPASVLYAQHEWLRSHAETTRRLASAIVRTLQWMHTHTPREIADKTPKSFRGEDEALYVEAVKNSMAMFSPDGVMDAAGAAAVHKLLAQSMDKVRAAQVDLSKTYTNEWVRPREQ